MQTTRLNEWARHNCWFQCVGFKDLSFIYCNQTVFSDMAKRLWQEGEERLWSQPFLSNPIVKVIQLLKRVPWTALKYVVENFRASTEPMEPQCGYRTQKPLSSVTTLEFEFWSKNFKTTLFCEGFYFFSFFLPLNYIIVRKLYGKMYSSQPLICIAWLKTQACKQAKFC